jgi:uncharacterized protein (TIGR03084 family)
VTTDPMTGLLEDFVAERQTLHQLIAALPEDAWNRASPAEGWTLRDCVSHLSDFDDRAALICRGITPPANPRDGELTKAQLDAYMFSPAAMVQWYEASGRRLVEAIRGKAANERLPWAGRPMSARSFLTARLMEHWSHGLDVFDAAGVAPVDTDRLRHVAHMGYITRDFAFANRGLEVPAGQLYVELLSPSGATWTWGPADAPDRIRGSAGDFCRVVTQRIHHLDTSLEAEGPHAREFLAIAQAFAGPTGSGRPRQGA